MRMTRRSAAPPATGRSASAGQTAGRGSEAAALQSQLGWQAGSPAQGTDSGQAARTNRQETAGQTERMTEGLAHTLGEDRAGHVWEEAGLPEVGDFSDQPARPLTSPERPEPAADDIPHAPDELNEPDNPWVDEVPLPESFADQPAASLYPRTLSGHSAGQGPDSPATAGAAGSPAMPAAEFPEESGFAREEQLFSLPRETVRLSAQVRAPRLRSDSPSAELSGQSLEVVRTMQGLRERLAGRRRSTLFAADQDETATADGSMPDMAAAPAFGGTGSGGSGADDTGSGGSGSGGTLSGDTLADGPAAPADSLWSGGAGSEDRAQAAPWQEEHLAGAGTFAGSAQAAMDTAGDSAVSARVREEEQTDRPAPVRRRLMTVVTVLGLAMLLLAGGLWYLLAHAPAEPALSRLQQRAAGSGHVPADSHAGGQPEGHRDALSGGLSSGRPAGPAASAAAGAAGSGEALTAEELAAAAALGLAPASDAPAAAGEEGILEVTLDSPQDSSQNAAQTVPHDSGSLPADSTAGAAPAASSASSAPAASDASGQDTAGAALSVSVPEPVRAALAAAAASKGLAQLQASDAQHGRSAAEGTLSALHSELAAMTRTLGELGTALGGVDRRTSAVLSRLDALASSVQSLHTALQAEEKAAATAHTQTAGKQVAEKQKTKAAAAQAKAGSKPDRKPDKKLDRTRDRKSAAHGSVQSTQTQDRQKARTVAARRGSGAARSQGPAGWSVQGLHENMAILRDASGRDWQVREGSRAGSLEVTDIDLARGRVVTTQGTLTWRP